MPGQVSEPLQRPRAGRGQRTRPGRRAPGRPPPAPARRGAAAAAYSTFSLLVLPRVHAGRLALVPAAPDVPHAYS
ncbi:hypothetical protein [Actinomadura sediminis]|uniref:Uncharacterized protein n=1 Tax=Actinomadura sediminis TaxID=1038904 RepID=A0ABW3ETA1_9ACTN